MTTQEKVLAILKNIENEMHNMKEIIRKDKKVFNCDSLVELEIALNNVFICVKENRDA